MSDKSLGLSLEKKWANCLIHLFLRLSYELLNIILILYIIITNIRGFLNPFAKCLAKILPITECNGVIIFIILLLFFTCDFCQIFLHDKRCSMRFCMVY